MKPESTAILIFAQSGRRDARAKGIPGGEQVLDMLTERTLQKVKRTGLSWFHVGEKQQTGNDFGERFSNALQSVFDTGIENLIVIGNDSPGLSTALLKKAARSLQKGMPILGPASDGGVYLIGLHSSHFVLAQFKAVPLQSSMVFHHLFKIIRVQAKNIPVVLECQMDLVSLGDLRNWTRNVAFAGDLILRMIKSLCVKLFILVFKELSNQDIYPFARHNKGSPIDPVMSGVL